MLEPFSLPFVQRGLLEVLALAIAAGLLGTWIVLRGLAFYAHAVGTAAFPGLVLADGLGFPAPLGAPLLPPARSARAAPTRAHMCIGPLAMSRAPQERGNGSSVPPAGALRLRDGGGAVRECRLSVACVGCSHPVHRRPRQSRADAAPGVQVVRTVARSTWTP